MSTHYGQIIEKVIRRNGHSISEVALITGVNRRSVYNWFNQRHLKADIIIRIGKAIHYDFSTLIPELDLTTRDFITLAPKLRGEDEQVTVWKDKYISLLERYNELLLAVPLSIDLV
jgi:hypothetical protein